MSEKQWSKRINKLAHFLAKQEGWKLKKSLDLEKEKASSPRAFVWWTRAREILEFLEDERGVG